MISVLLAAGADPAIPGIFDARSPLHHAASNGHLESVRRLIRDGKSMVDQPSALTNGNGPGHTPLLVACFQVNRRAFKKAACNDHLYFISLVHSLLDQSIFMTHSVKPLHF